MKIVEYAIHSLLQGLASGKVYALQAPQNTAAPFIVFQRAGGERYRSIAQPSGLARVQIQIDCYAADYYAAKSLAASVEDILDGYAGTVSYGSNSPQSTIRIGGITLESEDDILDQTEEPFLYRVITVYNVTFEQ
jgi:hypothetical protein